MTLFQLVKKNIKGNLKNYLLYFLSIVFGVVIYFMFVSLQYSDEVQEGIESSTGISNVFMVASIILLLFITVFILYSNSFFTMKRKREIGLYSLLGLRKKTIGKMLFYENLILSSIALVIGIVFGALFSKLFTMMLLRLLDASIEMDFSISISAVVNTLIAFSILILFTSVQGYRIIYRFRLIELFQAEKVRDDIPSDSKVLAGLGLFLFILGYGVAFQLIALNQENWLYLVIILICIIIGTYLLFRFFTVSLLKMLKRNQKFYYQGVHLISVSQLLYRIKGNARTLTMIALLSAIAISSISVGYTMYHNIQQNAHEEAPFSYLYVAKDKSFDDRVQQLIQSDEKHRVLVNLEIPVIHLKGDISNPKLRDYIQGFPVKFVSQSSYNRVSKLLNGSETIKLTGNQAAGIRPYLTDYTLGDYRGHTMKLEGNKQVIQFKSILNHRMFNWNYPDFSVVISDELFAQLSKQNPPSIYKAIQVKNQETTKETAHQLQQIATEDAQMMTYYSVYRKALEEGGINLFVLGFLSLVFLAASGSIIYFKQLNEAHTNKKSFEILRKIGFSKKHIRSAIREQIGIVFLLPIGIGMIHSLMILELLAAIKFIKGDFLVPWSISVIAYILIYFGYYLLTVNSSKKLANFKE